MSNSTAKHLDTSEGPQKAMCKCTSCYHACSLQATPWLQETFFLCVLFQMPPCVFLSFCYKINGHSQLMHMRIRYHFLADLHITRYAVHTVKDYSETGQTGFQ